MCSDMCTPPHTHNEVINVIMKEEVRVTVTLEEGEWTERVLEGTPWDLEMVFWCGSRDARRV